MRKTDEQIARENAAESDGWSRTETNLTPVTLRHATYYIDIENRFVLVEFSGTVTYDDIHEYSLQLRLDPRFSPCLAEIVDWRNADAVNVSSREALDLAAYVPFSLKAKRAFVANNPAQIEHAHIHRVSCPEGSNVRIFRSMEEAKRWIVNP